MPHLVRFLLVNLAAGFLIGAAVGACFVLSGANAELFEGQPLGTAMLLWAFGASFGLGMLGTGLAMISDG